MLIKKSSDSNAHTKACDCIGKCITRQLHERRLLVDSLTGVTVVTGCAGSVCITRVESVKLFK